MGVKYNNILVAVDGSKAAELAFKKAIEMSKENGAKLWIAHVLDSRTYSTMDFYDYTVAERVEKQAKELLHQYMEEARKQGIENVETSLTHGSPKVKIAKEIAPNYNVDLIVCGATGLNAVERIFIGSVSEHITRHAKCDVLIVRQ